MFKYGLGPWVDGIFSQSNFGIVTKMGFWLMEEPEAALQVSVTVPKRRDVVPLVDTLHSLMCAHTIPSQTNVASPIMNGYADPELLRLRGSGGASDEDWDRVRRSPTVRRSGAASSSTTGRANVIAAQWEHTKDRLAGIAGVQFRETGLLHVSFDRRASRSGARQSALGIPSLNLFGSRTRPARRRARGTWISRR